MPLESGTPRLPAIGLFILDTKSPSRTRRIGAPTADTTVTLYAQGDDPNLVTWVSQQLRARIGHPNPEGLGGAGGRVHG